MAHLLNPPPRGVLATLERSYTLYERCGLWRWRYNRFALSQTL
jgi:hypothetical protein